MGEHSAKFYLRHAGGGCDLILKRGCLANLRSFTDAQNRKVVVITGAGTPEALAGQVLAQCKNGSVCRLPAGCSLCWRLCADRDWHRAIWRWLWAGEMCRAWQAWPRPFIRAA